MFFGHIAVLVAVQMLGGAMKRVEVEVDAVLVTFEYIPVALALRILDDDMLVLGLPVLIDLIEVDRAFGVLLRRRRPR
jgi:hypothetical protein